MSGTSIPASRSLTDVTFGVPASVFRWAVVGGVVTGVAYMLSPLTVLLALALIPIFHAAISYHNSPWFSWLNWKSLRWIGLMSYAIYLFHIIAYAIVPAVFNTSSIPMKLAVVIPLTFLYAFSMYALVERPLAKLRKRYN